MRLSGSPKYQPTPKQAAQAARKPTKMKQQKTSVHFLPFEVTAQNSSRAMKSVGMTVSDSQQSFFLTVALPPDILVGASRSSSHALAARAQCGAAARVPARGKTHEVRYLSSLFCLYLFLLLPFPNPNPNPLLLPFTSRLRV